jgi:hypothetical protein
LNGRQASKGAARLLAHGDARQALSVPVGQVVIRLLRINRNLRRYGGVVGLHADRVLRAAGFERGFDTQYPAILFYLVAGMTIAPGCSGGRHCMRVLKGAPFARCRR